MRNKLLILGCILFAFNASAQKNKRFDATSPNGNIKLHIDIAGKMQWSVQQKEQIIIEPSTLSLQLQNEVLGDNATVTSSKTEKVNTTINAINYIKSIIPD